MTEIETNSYPGLRGALDDDKRDKIDWKLKPILKCIFQVSGVLLIAPTANSLESRRKEFSHSMKEVSNTSKKRKNKVFKIFFQFLDLYS